MRSSCRKFEDQMQTHAVTDATETASGTAKMNGNAQGVESTQAEAETHLHSYSLKQPEESCDAINIGAEGSQMFEHSTVHVPMARHTSPDADVKILLFLASNRLGTKAWNASNTPGRVDTLSDVVLAHDYTTEPLRGAELLAVILRHVCRKNSCALSRQETERCPGRREAPGTTESIPIQPGSHTAGVP